MVVVVRIASREQTSKNVNVKECRLKPWCHPVGNESSVGAGLFGATVPPTYARSDQVWCQLTLNKHCLFGRTAWSIA